MCVFPIKSVCYIKSVLAKSQKRSRASVAFRVKTSDINKYITIQHNPIQVVHSERVYLQFSGRSG